MSSRQSKTVWSEAGKVLIGGVPSHNEKTKEKGKDNESREPYRINYHKNTAVSDNVNK